MIERARKLLKRFLRDQSGNYIVIAAVSMPMLIGGAGLGTEGGFWLYEHHLTQSAADSAAISAATSYGVNGGTNLNNQAYGVTPAYGLTNGVKNVVVTVNQPPTSGIHKNTPGAVEVIITQKQARLLSSLWNSKPVTITARSVAVANGGVGCLLVLDPTANGAATVQGTASIALNGCSMYDNSNSTTAVSAGGSSAISARSVNTVGDVSGASQITTTNGIVTHTVPTTDPYAGVNIPSYSGCDQNNLSVKTTVTLSPGTYYIDRGSLQVNGGATLQGSGVTLVFTSSNGHNYAGATINGGATVNLTAPTSGTFSGIAIYGDRGMPTGTKYSFNGGSGQGFGGAVYLPKGAIDYSGGGNVNTTCTQVIGDTVNFSGNSTLAVNCSNYGTKNIGVLTASLVE
jgi:Flp pilus assembly protein TadG